MTNQYFLDRLAGRNLNLRAADADRERTADRLRTGHAEGRLDLAEFQERIERCYEAKTFGELEALVTDLPRQDERDEGRSARWSRRAVEPGAVGRDRDRADRDLRDDRTPRLLDLGTASVRPLADVLVASQAVVGRPTAWPQGWI